MVTVKKDTVNAKLFEHKMISLINDVKTMDIPDVSKEILLKELKKIHNECLEWEEPKPKNDFKIFKELLIE